MEAEYAVIPGALPAIILSWLAINVSLFIKCTNDVNLSSGLVLATFAILLSFVSVIMSPPFEWGFPPSV